jgi:hypothetical protein
LRAPSEFIHVTCYEALRHLADFKASWSFGEGAAERSERRCQ